MSATEDDKNYNDESYSYLFDQVEGNSDWLNPLCGNEVAEADVEKTPHSSKQLAVASPMMIAPGPIDFFGSYLQDYEISDYRRDLFDENMMIC
jgi:hypothetical protein